MNIKKHQTPANRSKVSNLSGCLFITNEIHFVMPEQMHDILIGTLLDDGNLANSQKGQTWSYRCLHSDTARDYLFHKYFIFKDCCLNDPSFQEFKGFTGKKFQRWYFNRRRLHIFQKYSDLFYTRNVVKKPSWRKKIPFTIENYLSPTALA